MNKKSSKKKLQSHQFLLSKNQQLGHILEEIECPEQQTIIAIQPEKAVPQDVPDSLTLLLSKAKKATEGNPRYKIKHKTKKISQEEAFMTGVEMEMQKINEQYETQKQQALDEQVKKLLQKKSIDDELALLKKEIKQTNGVLRSYSKQVLKTEKSVGRLAGRYDCYFNLQVPVTQPSVDFSGFSMGMRSLKQLKIPQISHES